jgi:hypothetical protein
MNEKFISLIKQLKETREQYGGYLQKPAANKDIERLNNAVKTKFKMELSAVYKSILLETNGFNENGVFLYGTETDLIEGYWDRSLDGFLEANEVWHENDDFSSYLFYAEADLYVFVQSLKDKSYLCYARDSFDNPVFKTNDDNDFFEKIFRLAIDDSFYLE